MATLQQMFYVRGKPLIVTGGASGIGCARAEVIANNQMRVCISGTDEAEFDSTVVIDGGAMQRIK